MTATRLTLAVGSLVSLVARSCYTKQVVIYHHCHGLKPGEISRKCSKMKSRQPDGESPSSLRNLSSRCRSQGSPGIEGRRNEMDRATERTVERNGTERTVELNKTEHFTLFLGKRCRRADGTDCF